MITKLRKRLSEVVGTGNQNRLADQLHINRARLSEYATGVRAIPTHHMISLCQALDCSPTDIVGYVEMEEA